ncbi:MAG: ferric reductase-like transmembrane domain-containing protein [Candidatus Shapirobacteria bacterium]
MSKSSIADSLASPLLFVSQLFSLFGTILFCYTFVLASRSRFLEKMFGGLDRVIKLHHIVGGISFVLLINHPILLAVEALPNYGLASKYLFLSSIFEYNVGVIAIYGMILLLLLTLVIKLPYDLWIKTHDTFGIVLLFACLHIFFISSDVSRYLPLRIWMFLNLGIGFYFYIYKVFLYKWFGPKYEYVVEKVVKTGDFIEVYMSHVNELLKYKSGQFAFVSFKQDGLTESHPFSFSSSPDEKFIRFTIKILGDYTLKLKDLKVGTMAKVWGSYGRFYYNFFENKDVACIAGGVGITPFVSLLKHEETRALTRNISLFYSAQSESTAIYNKYFSGLEKSLNNFKYFPNYGENMPRLTGKTIVDKVGSINNKLFFICGPTEMMHTISAQLKESGVKSNNIIFEDFNFKS